MFNYFIPQSSKITESGQGKTKQGLFSKLSEATSEASMYKTFVVSESCAPAHTIDFFSQVAPLLQNVVLVNTAKMKDQALHRKFTFACQPDFSMYSKDSNHNFEPNSTLIKFPLKFKSTPDQDHFTVKPATYSSLCPS